MRLDLSRVLRRSPLPGRYSRSSNKKAQRRLVFVHRGSKARLVRWWVRSIPITGTDTKNVGGVSLDKLGKEVCSLQREGNGLYAFPVLLNAQPVTLPALRASCVTEDGRADFYILDQADYPLMLAWKLGEGSQLQVIKITYPPALPSRKAISLRRRARLSSS